MKVVGLDLSLVSTGVALVNPDWSQLAVVDRIQTKARGDVLAARSDRLDFIVESIREWVSEEVDLVVIEGPAFSRANAGTHDRAGLWWLVVQYLLHIRIPVAVVPPTTRAKYATGKGNAGKDLVLASVVRRYPTVDVAGNDEADALILAAMGARWLGAPIDNLPQTHLAALSGVAWPEEDA